MLRILKMVTALSCIAVLGGCAIGVTHEYQNAAPELKATAGTKLGLGVLDRRVYIVSKNKPESFVGLTRGGFNNPFDVKTVSGKPLANDFTQTIQTALTDKGVKVIALSLHLGTDESEAVKRLSGAGDKAILIVINEWKSDTFTETTLAYDIQAKVIDPRGKVLASKKLSGKDNLGRGGMNAPEYSRKVVPVAFRKKLEELFAAPEISRHL
jgi:hypothetical protein